MELTSLAMEIGRHPRWIWNSAMMTISACGKSGLYSYMPNDIEVFPDLLCSRVRGRMLADIFALAPEVRKDGAWMTVVMSDKWMCMARGHEALPSCWLAMSRWLEARDGGVEGVAK